MNLGHVLLWSSILVGGPAMLYGVHRLCLWLEKRGWLYYKHQKPSSSSASCFVALQQVLEPRTHHVLQVQQEKHHHAAHEGSGRDESSPTDGDRPGTGSGQEPAAGTG